MEGKRIPRVSKNPNRKTLSWQTTKEVFDKLEEIATKTKRSKVKTIEYLIEREYDSLKGG